MTGETDRSNTLDGVILVPEPSRKRLNDRQVVDYQGERRDCLEWLLALMRLSTSRSRPLLVRRVGGRRGR